MLALQCSRTNFTQRSIVFIATYSGVLWVLHGVCCPVCRQRVWLHKPDLASVLVFALVPHSTTRDKKIRGSKTGKNAVAGYHLWGS